MYLATLVRAREGACPLLEPGIKQYKVRFDEFVSAVDMVLAEVKFYEREAIKTEIAEMNGKSDNIDLEVSLEMMVDLWLDLDARLTSRLEALFVAHDANGASAQCALCEWIAECWFWHTCAQYGSAYVQKI